MKLPSPGYTIRSKYELGECIGRGGMGAVFRARHLIWNEPRAIKVMLTGDRHSPAVETFLAESRALRQLRHPHIVQIEDVDYDDEGRLFIVMEMLEGEALHIRLQRLGGALEEKEAVWIGMQLSSALHESHCKGILHLDIKPQNILLLTQPSAGPTFVKLIDFGIAKVRPRADDDSTVTIRGLTPTYASPEQLLTFNGRPGPSIDERSDVYSVGIVLYQMLTGELPFDARQAHDRLNASPVPPHLAKPGISESVSNVVMKALACNPLERYRYAADLELSLRSTIVGQAGFGSEDASMVKEASARMRLMLSAQPARTPENTAVYVLHSEPEFVLIKRDASQFLLPVFTSPAYAEDYRNAFPYLQNRQIGAMTLQNLARYIAGNRTRGVSGAVFNQCPRCPHGNQLSAEGCMDTSQSLKVLALTVATRQLFVERNLRIAEAEPDLLKQRLILENTRDHIDPGAAPVHYELGMNALRLGSGPMVDEALTALDRLGPGWAERIRHAREVTRRLGMVMERAGFDADTTIRNKSERL